MLSRQPWWQYRCCQTDLCSGWLSSIIVCDAGMAYRWTELGCKGMRIFKDFSPSGNPLGARCAHQRVVSLQELFWSRLEILTQMCAKTEEAHLKGSTWLRLMFSIQLNSLPAWKRTNLPKPPSSTCTTRVACLMTSQSGSSAPASWGSTASPLTSRTALWPLGRTSTSVSVHT